MAVINNSANYQTTQYFVLVGDAGNQIAGVDPTSNVGYVLTSNGASAAPTFQASSSNITFDTDSGTATSSGGVISFYANSLGSGDAGESMSFSGSGSTVYLNTTDANNCVFIGNYCGYSDGSNSVGLGYAALQNSGGTNCVGIGYGACINGGAYNVAVGINTISVNTTSYCTAVGYQALQSVSNISPGGIYNTGVGFEALLNVVGGAGNTALGYSAGSMTTSGSYNVFIGANAGVGLTGGGESSNIIIGYNVPGVASTSNQLIIGNGTGTGNGELSSCVICGISGETSSSGVEVYINTSNVLGTSTSSKRFKKNIQDMGDASSPMLKLRPVTFEYKESRSVSAEESELIQYGLIAEEVLEVMPQLVVYNKEGEVEAVRYRTLAPMLLNELQKLLKRVDVLEQYVGNK